MPNFIQFAVPVTCASLVVPLAWPEKLVGQAYDQPHNHSESEPLEPSTLAPSIYDYTTTTAAMVLTDFYPVQWVIQSPQSRFDCDLLVAKRLKTAGITVIVQRAPDDPKGGKG